MKYFLHPLVLGLLSVVLAGCSDGDLQIETIDFDTVDVQFCENATTVNSRIFFKINNDEALILELQNGLLKNEVSDGTLRSTVPGQSQLTYRIFTDNVTKNYFCSAIPPSLPTVSREIEAQAGEVLVTTLRSAADTTVFEHTIALSGISLVNDQGERITDLRINEFGSITTSQ